ncbi:HAMP domain-containing protein [Gordonia sp. X0973]|uniref:sensor histidine kinase n=1 Tax=Gordonia sp. X0973 TaxID=2742602 RepID=UPI00158143BC|nr:ATP-binding protein [Gordonia sp. X0973]QKT06558.1 HAMP domain-containing protein [Gordonia sp. X0973]
MASGERIRVRSRPVLNRLRPVRARLTLLATALVTVALAVAAVAMVFTLRHILLRNADSATQSRAEQIATALPSEGIDGIDHALLTPTRNVDVIQILDSHGRVLRVNNPEFSRPLSTPVPAGQVRVIHGAHASADDVEFRTSAKGIDGRHGHLTIAVGAAEEPINHLVVLVAVLCCILFPLIVIGMAVLTHYFVGRALAPVDELRRRVDEISGGDLSRRVPVPATGDEISTLAVTMNRMLTRIEDARTRQVRFVNDASHELNSPLTTIVGLLDLANEKGQPIDADTVGSVMLPDALRLQQMVADLLLLARADESGLALHVAETDLDDIVGAEVARVTALTDLVVDAHLRPARVSVDGEKVARALRNIVDNAVRHAVTRIAVEMAVDDESVTVTVADDGPGIPDADKARVLERFVRLDQARGRRTGGSGLGLAIVSEIVTAHDGEVIVGDASGGSDGAGGSGHGAAVGFRLPLVIGDLSRRVRAGSRRRAPSRSPCD